MPAENGNWLNNGNGKWTWMMPGEIGQSPAAALQYRRGDVKESEPVVRQISSDADVLALNGTGIVEGKNVDFRMTAAPASSDTNQLSSFDPLTYFAGRVERSFDENAKQLHQDLSKFIDRKSKRIRSVTGELTWNYGVGLMTVDTPNSQAATGFLSKAGQIKLRDLTIDSLMEYGTVHIISLDGQPISTSRKILVQAFSEEKMYGFRVENGVIKDPGRAPINVRDLHGTVTFKNASGLQSIVLDPNGYAAGKSSSMPNGTLTLHRDAMYTIVIR
jgi:hypothetical protein